MEIELRNIEVRFGETAALKDVSLKVKDRELMSILGPSGCGKTTLLRVIAGLIRPDSGRVLFNGRDVTELPPEKRNAGMVFQSYALFPHMDVFGNVAFGLRMRKANKEDIRRRVSEVLELVGLKGYERRKPSELSGGEQQRVALARAIAPKPDILLLDEPLSALDAKLRISLRSEIRRIQREVGITALYVTHDREEAMAISDRLAVMNAGRMEQVGEPMHVYRNPNNRFVAEFLGDANLIPVKVEKGIAHTPFGDIPSEKKGDAFLFFRPGDCTIGEGLDAEVISVEPCGDVLSILLKVGPWKIKAISIGSEVRAGDSVKVFVKPEYMRLL